MLLSKNELEEKLSGFSKYIGIEIDDVEKDFALGHLNLTDNVMNHMGAAHGGSVFALLDTVAGYLARYRSGKERKCVTSCSSISFLRPVKGEKLYARSTIIKEGKNMGHVYVTATDDENKVCAYATFEFFYFE